MGCVCNVIEEYIIPMGALFSESARAKLIFAAADSAESICKEANNVLMNYPKIDFFGLRQ